MFALAFSLSAFGQNEMILQLNLPGDLSPLEANAGEDLSFVLNNTGKPSVNVDKITIFIGGAATMDEDYEFVSVIYEEDFGGGTQPVEIPHESTGGLSPNDLSWGSDASSVYINNWTKDVNDPVFTFRLIQDRFDEGDGGGVPYETISLSINGGTATGGGANNVTINQGGNGSFSIVDNDTAGIVVSDSGDGEKLVTAEDDTHRSFTINLTSQPYPTNATVLIPLTKQQTGADPVTGVLKVGTTVINDGETVELNSSNWEAGITVTVESGGGTTFDDDEKYTVVTGDPTSALDAQYNAFTANDAGDVDVEDLNNDSGSVLQIDSGFLTFQAQETESDNVINIPVERVCSSACSTDTVSVKWRTAEGTADQTQFDPNPASPNGVLEWTAGDDSNKTIAITIKADDIPEDAMNFTVEIYDPRIDDLVDPGASVNDSAKLSTITIPENDALVPGSITVADIVVNEAVGTATLTLKRVGGSDRQIALDWTTVEGDGNGGDDATTPEDYADDTNPDTDEASGTVTWADDDMNDKTIDIVIVDDSDEENDEFFRVSFSLNAGETDALLSGFSDFDTEALVTILANDATGTRGNIVITNAQIVEGNPGDDVQVVLTAERVQGTDGPLNVTWNTADGDDGYASKNAIAGNDYEAVVDGTISWADTELGSRNLVVNIVEDTVEEALEFFKVSLSIDADDPAVCEPDEGEPPAWCGFDPASVVYPVGQADFAKVDIEDDDAPGEITVVGAPVSVGEGAGQVTITLSRSNGSQGDITIDWETADGNSGTASENAVTTGTSENGEADYTTSSGSVQWDNVTGDRSFNIPIDNDDVVEDAEKFRILLTLGDGSDSPSDFPAVIEVQINDNDSESESTINVPLARTISESSPVVNITVTRIGTDGPAKVFYSTASTNPVSATSPDQYDAVVNGLVEFVDGQSFATASVGINEDDNDIDQKFLVIFSKGDEDNDYTILNDTTEVTITDLVDNEPGQILINAFDAVEGSNARVTFSRVNGSAGEVVLNWTMTDGTAKSTGGANNCAVDENSGNDNDYTRTASGQITWADKVADVQEILIPTLEDVCIENTENFSLSFTLTDDSADATLSSDTVSVNIIDNDGGGTFSISDNQVLENTSVPNLLKVERLGGSQGFVYLEYYSVNGTAVANGDYDAIAGSLTWDDGDSSPRYLTTAIHADTIVEGNETFTVVLDNVDAERPVEVIKGVGTVTIMDPYPVPTLSQWSLILLMLLVGWVAYRNIQVRRLSMH
jgi:hypothetical protein